VTNAAAWILSAFAAATGCGNHSQADFGSSTAEALDSSTPDDAASSTFTSTGQDSGVGSFGGASSSSTRHNDLAKPVLDGAGGGNGAAVPGNAPTLFGPTSQGARSGGPCIIEPGSNALLPRNWLRPLFRWNAPSGQNLFELRVHAANQDSDLVVYTTSTSWTMPKDLWGKLRIDSNDVPMTVSVRGGTLNGGQLTKEALGSSQTMGVAPADAPGAIVYWTSSWSSWVRCPCGTTDSGARYDGTPSSGTSSDSGGEAREGGGQPATNGAPSANAGDASVSGGQGASNDGGVGHLAGLGPARAKDASDSWLRVWVARPWWGKWASRAKRGPREAQRRARASAWRRTGASTPDRPSSRYMFFVSSVPQFGSMQTPQLFPPLNMPQATGSLPRKQRNHPV
jgi:hypothetical protein